VKSFIDEDEPHLESSDDDKRVTVIPAPKFDIPETPVADTQLNFRPGRGGGHGGSAFLQKASFFCQFKNYQLYRTARLPYLPGAQSLALE